MQTFRVIAEGQSKAPPALLSAALGRVRIARRSVSQVTARTKVAPSSTETVVPKVIGDTKVGVRNSSKYVYSRCEHVGNSNADIRLRTDAGELLAKIDLCTAFAVSYFLSGKKPGGHFIPPKTHTMATVAFNSFMFSQPVYEHDVVRTSSQVIHAGSTSIAAHARLERQNYETGDFEYLGESFVTFVTLNRHNMSIPLAGLIPAVELSTRYAQQKNELYNLMKSQEKSFANLVRNATSASRLTAENIESAENKRKLVKVPISSTIIQTDHLFPSTTVNANGVIFGGATLAFMEQCALHCGRVFARRPRIFTLGMLSMSFKGAILRDDSISCFARVACVRRSTMIIDVRIDAEFQGKKRSTNTASFLLIAIGEDGVPFEIEKGIDLRSATPEELIAYWKGCLQMEKAAENRKMYSEYEN